jgi:hypothetical protein
MGVLLSRTLISHLSISVNSDPRERQRERERERETKNRERVKAERRMYVWTEDLFIGLASRIERVGANYLLVRLFYRSTGAEAL